ncbi:MAG: hypothetical protein MZU97_15405 [Bacillus subtilis]|nr:hypothetical protein [Bacillus subtilis]
MTQSLYVTLGVNPAALELDQLVYLFQPQAATDFQLTRLFQYHLYQPGFVAAKHGAIILDIVRPVDLEVSSEQVVARLETFFPKLAKAVIAMEFGLPSPKTGMLALPELRKGLSINEQIEIENGEHLKRFENLYLTGPWFRPEAGLYGQLHTGIMVRRHRRRETLLRRRRRRYVLLFDQRRNHDDDSSQLQEDDARNDRTPCQFPCRQKQVFHPRQRQEHRDSSRRVQPARLGNPYDERLARESFVAEDDLGRRVEKRQLPLYRRRALSCTTSSTRFIWTITKSTIRRRSRRAKSTSWASSFYSRIWRFGV